MLVMDSRASRVVSEFRLRAALLDARRVHCAARHLPLLRAPDRHLWAMPEFSGRLDYGTVSPGRAPVISWIQRRPALYLRRLGAHVAPLVSTRAEPDMSLTRERLGKSAGSTTV